MLDILTMMKSNCNCECDPCKKGSCIDALVKLVHVKIVPAVNFFV